MKHLWEVDHPYYCAEGNFYSREPYRQYANWADFAATMGKSDPELNLLFRWDWQAPTDDDGEEIQWRGDENYRDSTFQTFWVMQRKGIFACHEISVCRADEPAIVEWLRGRLPHLLKLWAPIVSAKAVASAEGRQ